MLVGVLYRHPTKNITPFLTKLENILNICKSEKKEIVLMGDFNLDLLKSDNNNDISSFLDIMLTNFLQPHIMQPTKFFDDGKYSLIDNIFYDQIEYKCTSGNLIPHISDHLANFLIINKSSSIKTKTCKNKIIRDYKNFKKEAFLNELAEMDVKKISENITGANSKYNILHDSIDYLLSKHAPLKKMTNKKMKQMRKPWISDNILKLIGQKNSLYSQHLQTGNHEILLQYRTLRNNINHSIRRNKYLYYKAYFSSCNNNIRKFWKGINNFLNAKNRENDTPLMINKKGKPCIDPYEIAAEFNSYFTNVAPSLVKKLPKQSNKKIFSDYLGRNNENSFFLSPTTSNEVFNTIKKLDQNKATDIYNFPVKIIKDISDIISSPLSDIINESFSTGVFPERLKLAKVLPLHKGNSKLETNNYRPISILPIFDKILEKLMYSRLISFLTENAILSTCQYGFRENHSTNLAILDLISKVQKSNENGNLSCVIFLDFAKAFDTVNHEILLKKLLHYGIRGKAHEWFTSYLTDRKQSVSVAGSLSEPLPIKCGVPQGSVLGPLLFLIYINDIILASNIFKFTLFADDTCLFSQKNDLKSLESSTNKELTKISDWLIANKLSLNISKSNFLLFKNKNNAGTQSINIGISGQKIAQKQTVKYLGLKIDEKLSWDKHISHVSIKVAQGTGIIYKLRHVLSPKSIQNIYSCFTQSHVQYCISLWGFCNSPSLTKLKHSLKKCVKVMNPKNNIEVNQMLMNKLLNLDQLLILDTCKIAYAYYHGTLPINLNHLFHLNRLNHSHNNRKFATFNVPHSSSYNKISHIGSLNWNKYCLDLIRINCKNLFFQKIKSKLLNENTT